MMPLERANWIRDVVLAPHRPGGGEPDITRVCRCQWGPCGYCTSDRPERCAQHLVVGNETYLINRRGQCLANVWLAGRACRWLCPGPPPPVQAGQQSLFPEMTNAPRVGLANRTTERSS